MIRIANKPRKRFEIDSDSDEASIEISSDDNDEVDEENEKEENETEENETEENETEKNETEKNETEENEIEESETEKEAKIEMRQISASDRHLRNAALPVRYRDS